jgi:hypothetical protein
MGEPLSVASAVVGLLATTAHVTKTLVTFTDGVIGAPESARHTLSEVNDIETILLDLQQLLDGAAAINPAQARLTKVEGIFVVLMSMVITFSDLTKLLEKLKTKDMNMIDRIKWARKEKRIAEIIQRLEKNKSSMIIMLSIFQR